MRSEQKERSDIDRDNILVEESAEGGYEARALGYHIYIESHKNRFLLFHSPKSRDLATNIKDNRSRGLN